MQKKIVAWLPFFLFLPVSFVVGIWMVINTSMLLQAENRFYFYFYILFLLLPLYLAFFHPRDDFGKDILNVLKGLKAIDQKWLYGLLWGVFSLIFLYIAAIHISTYYERDRWVLSNEIQIVPIDMVIPSRMAYFFGLFMPTDVSIPFTNLLFLTLWFVFLVYVGEKKGTTWFPIFLVFIATFLTGTLFTAQYATFELPAAILSFIGLYGVWRKHTSIGLFFLTFGSVFKNTGIFFVATGAVLLLILLWQEGALKNIFKILDMPFVIFLAIFFLASHWGSFYYITVLRGGPGYLVDPSADQIFWLTPLVVFVKVLAANYTLLFIFGMIGSFFARSYGVLAFVSLGVLMALRSFSKWADDGYAMMFIPALSFFALLGIEYLQKKISTKWFFALLSLFIVGFGIYKFSSLLEAFPGGMHRLNSNFDQFIVKMARRFPEDGFIYERDISLKPYLKNNRGGDLDAIRFRSYSDDRGDFVEEMSQPGCKLIIAENRHLQIVGISKEDLIAMGYSEHPYVLVDSSGTWVSYSKECNAWEYD